MVKVFYEGDVFDMADDATFSEFIKKYLEEDDGYIINGEALPLDTELKDYMVIEKSANGIHLHTSISDIPEFEKPEVVEIMLNDFTGFSGQLWVANNIAAVKERYNQPVAVTIIRDNQMLNFPTNIQTGDRVMVVQAGGMKGAGR